MNTAVLPFSEVHAPPDWHTVDFISDLHLQNGEPETVAAWQRYMGTTQADALFILGDLFEVWVGDDALGEPGSFEAQTCTVLAETAQRLPVYFMHGNRDFLAGTAFLEHCGMTGVADPTILVFAGQRMVLSHGDLLCLDDVDYQRFRQEVRSAAWQTRFLAQPLATRRAKARGIREQSQARQESIATYADVDHPAAINWLRTSHATTLIHGHTHRPADHALAPGLARVVLSDWDAAAHPPRAQILRLQARGLERVALAPCKDDRDIH